MTPPLCEAGDFVPPFPHRHAKAPSTLRRLMIGRKNLLAMWEDESFDLEFSEGRLFTRMVYVCNSPNAVQFAFNHQHASFERKSPQMRHTLKPLLGDGLFISDGETWRERRDIVQPIVHRSRMHDFAPVMAETAREVRDQWLEKGTFEVDMLAECAHLTAEIICRTIFGRELGRRFSAEVVGGFSDYQAAASQVDFMSFFGLPDWLPRYLSPKARRSVERIHSVLDEIITSYEKLDRSGETSLIGRLLTAKDAKGEPLSKSAIRNEAAVLFMAGHETTANSLAWAWYLLSQSPRVEAKLHEELDAVLGSRTPTLDDVPNLVYTRAVIDETMRLYPPVPVLARESLAEERYLSFTLPKGSLVMVVPWLLHRHRKFWRKPDHFIPERFLPGSDEPVSKYAYVPFSIGPRICPGMAFGLTEAVICLATLAQAFRFEIRPDHIVEPVCKLTLRPENGLPMIGRPRTRAPLPS